MTTLTIMRGLPGCGKTTYSDVLIKPRPGNFSTVRLGNDFICKMLYGVDYSSEVKMTIVDHLNNLIEYYRHKEFNVIIDNTNLHYAPFIDLLRFGLSAFNTVTVVDMRKVPYMLCQARNQSRERVVPPREMLRIRENMERGMYAESQSSTYREMMARMARVTLVEVDQ